ncbi:aprataxin-like protein [Drosophila rhopaloa]|uniref:Aprataxin-like protein n=1 Tax=Drosophila rhopaloa TaxID=1041015 RepID=A0A6P4DY72_DRORH|nr:aprataxin-like protein [Drosophila rhopaloa]
MSWQNGLIRDMVKQEYLIVSSKLGVVISDKFPKAMHHYLVLPLADIPSIFQLDRSHLPLLQELYRLAQNAVEIKGVRWEDFQVGFHAEPSLHRLHLHVISTDFVSPSLKTKKHWNSHNTELFVPYEKLYAQLEKENCFARLPKSLVEKLLSKPLICNQCEFVSDSLRDLKAHLYNHWQRKEVSKNPFQTPQMQQVENAFANLTCGPPINIKNQLNSNNPTLNIHAMNPPQSYKFNNRAPVYNPRGTMLSHGNLRNGPRFPPNQHHNQLRHPIFNRFRAPPPMHEFGISHYPSQAFAGQEAWPKNYKHNQNLQKPQNQLYRINNQNPNQNRPNLNQKNRNENKKTAKQKNQSKSADNLQNQEAHASPPQNNFNPDSTS